MKTQNQDYEEEMNIYKVDKKEIRPYENFLLTQFPLYPTQDQIKTIRRLTFSFRLKDYIIPNEGDYDIDEVAKDLDKRVVLAKRKHPFRNGKYDVFGKFTHNTFVTYYIENNKEIAGMDFVSFQDGKDKIRIVDPNKLNKKELTKLFGKEFQDYILII